MCFRGHLRPKEWSHKDGNIVRQGEYSGVPQPAYPAQARSGSRQLAPVHRAAAVLAGHGPTASAAGTIVPVSDRRIGAESQVTPTDQWMATRTRTQRRDGRYGRRIHHHQDGLQGSERTSRSWVFSHRPASGRRSAAHVSSTRTAGVISTSSRASIRNSLATGVSGRARPAARD